VDYKTFHLYILETLRPIVRVSIKSYNQEYDKLSSKDILHMLFTNYRYSNQQHTGLRLSYFGNKMMSSEFKEYKFEFKGKINHKTYILLDRNMKWPYYIGKKYVSFYSENDAAWFKLNDQDLGKYVDFI